jgi:hypothetical protein
MLAKTETVPPKVVNVGDLFALLRRTCSAWSSCVRESRAADRTRRRVKLKRTLAYSWIAAILFRCRNVLGLGARGL